MNKIEAIHCDVWFPFTNSSDIHIYALFIPIWNWILNSNRTEWIENASITLRRLNFVKIRNLRRVVFDLFFNLFWYMRFNKRPYNFLFRAKLKIASHFQPEKKTTQVQPWFILMGYAFYLFICLQDMKIKKIREKNERKKNNV